MGAVAPLFAHQVLALADVALDDELVGIFAADIAIIGRNDIGF